MSADLVPFVPRRNTGAGLTGRECDIIAQAAPDLPGAWHIQYDKNDRGHGSITLAPGRDEHGHETPVFLIWREGGVFTSASVKVTFMPDWAFAQTWTRLSVLCGTPWTAPG